MPKGYGYGNARLRAMRSRLLTEAHYEALLAREKIEEVITALTETPYKADIEAALVRNAGVLCVFEALRTNLIRTLGQVREFFEGAPRTLVDILLQRWDRHNLITILRGQSRHVSSQIVLSTLVPVGQLDEVSLRELARQPGLRATLDLMTTWRLPYAPVLRQVRARSGTVPDLDQLELALNRYHYSSLFEALSQGNDKNCVTLLKYLKSEVDLINIRTTLRLSRIPEISHLIEQRYNATDVSALLIEPGGWIPAWRLAQLIGEAGGVAGLVQGLSETRYGAALEAGWRGYQTNGHDFTKLERALERWQARRTIAMFNGDPLGIAIPIAYLGCKELEVANLRLIAQAVELTLKRDEIRQELIMLSE